MNDRLIRRAEVTSRVGLCERQIRNLEAEGLFPRRVKINPSGHAVAWSEQAVSDWIAERLAEQVGG